MSEKLTGGLVWTRDHGNYLGELLTVGAKDTRTSLLGGDAQEVRERVIQASPMTCVTKAAAPLLIMHGDADKTVPLA